MPTKRISGLGEVGIRTDVPGFAIPDNAFSAGQNVRAYHGRLINFGGNTVYANPPISPYGVFSVVAPDQSTLWVEAGLTKVYVYNGVTHSNITRQSASVDVDYTMNEYFDRWTGGAQGSIAFLCNGADSPQQWDQIDVNTRLRDMVYNPQGAAGSQTWGELNYSAFAMRPYRNTIFAMNLRRGGTFFPSVVQWCNFIAPGDTNPDFVPRPENFAGEVPLGETGGGIIDGAPLRDDFIIYKQDAVFRCSFVGAVGATRQPFRFSRLPEYVRIINRNCIGVTREFHVLAGRDDVTVFDGNVFRSLLDRRLREWYTNTIQPERLLTTFVAVHEQEHEVWICFKKAGETGTQGHPDRAIVWNYHEDTLSLNDLPQVKAMDAGVIVPAISDNFDDPPDITFDEDLKIFDQTPFSQAKTFLVGAHDSSLSVFGEDPSDNGQPRLCQAERTGLVLTDPISGIRSNERVMRLREFRPYINGTSSMFVQVGAQLEANGPITWEPEQPFDPQNQHHANFRATGRYFGYRIRSFGAENWELTDVEMDAEVVRKG